MIPYTSLSDFYKSIFGMKIYKISLDAGCTCPNRDGTKGSGGCIFCSERGSGDFVPERNKSVEMQILEAKEKIESKLRGRSGNRQGKYIAYFQNFTSTYGNEDLLIEKYESALKETDIAGISIATRPDCVSERILEWISLASERTFVQIELGLQTSNEKTGLLINRCYTNKDFSETVSRIQKKAPKVHIVAHLIFGLPYETEKDMMDSVNFVDSHFQENQIFGIKITVLYVVRHTKISEMFLEGKFRCLSKEEYFSLIKKALLLLGENCIVHRITGDPPKNILIEPKWTMDKKRVMNEMKEFLDS